MNGKKRILITGSTNASPGNTTQETAWSAILAFADEERIGLDRIAVVHFAQRGVDQAVAAACRNNNVTHIPVERREGEKPRDWQRKPLSLGVERVIALTTPGSKQNERIIALALEAGVPVTEIPIPKKGRTT